jgi:hypothetical protein
MLRAFPTGCKQKLVLMTGDFEEKVYSSRERPFARGKSLFLSVKAFCPGKKPIPLGIGLLLAGKGLFLSEKVFGSREKVYASRERSFAGGKESILRPGSQ